MRKEITSRIGWLKEMIRFLEILAIANPGGAAMDSDQARELLPKKVRSGLNWVFDPAKMAARGLRAGSKEKTVMEPLTDPKKAIAFCRQAIAKLEHALRYSK